MTEEQLSEYFGISTDRIFIHDGTYCISNATISEIDVNFFKMRISICFSKCVFECNLSCMYSDKKQEFKTKMEFLECIFEKEICFQGCIFIDDIEFLGCQSKDKVILSECDFKKSFKFCEKAYGGIQSDTEVKQDMIIRLCNFQDINLSNLIVCENFYFTSSTILQDACFENMEFKKNFHTKYEDYKNNEKKIKKHNTEIVFKGNVSFRNTNFKNETMFYFCTFEKYVDFSDCIFDNFVSFRRIFFEKDALFCNTKFNKAPLFNQVIFNKNADFLNTEMSFVFYELREQIEEKVQSQCKETRGKTISEIREEIANNFQDSFRLIKNTLVKYGDMLGALKYHKMELYSKEISLIHTINKEKISKTYISACKNMDRFKNLADGFQLAFYRHLSDHHTDLLRVVNNWLMVTCIYSIFVFIFSNNFILKKKLSFNFSDFFTLLHTTQGRIELATLFAIFSLLFFMIFVIYKNIIKDFFRMKNSEGEGISLRQFIWRDLLTLKSPTIYFLCYILMGFLLFEFSQSLSIFEKTLSPILLFVNLVMFAIVALPIFIRSILIRSLLIFSSYLLFFIIVLPNLVSLVNPIIKNLYGKNDYSLDQSYFLVMILLYTLFQSIILWSLQKTARKNSIIPS